MLFTVIAVSDAREFKIPNKWLLMILLLSFFIKVLDSKSLTVLMYSLLAGLIFFIGGLALYFLGAMAPGDVKLLGVVGFWLGWGELISAMQWIAVATVVVGSFYALMQVAITGHKIKSSMEYYVTYLASKKILKSSSTEVMTNTDKLVMPFAPVVVIGVALHSYF
jgi:prepilin peptidase CpaA